MVAVCIAVLCKTSSLTHARLDQPGLASSRAGSNASKSFLMSLIISHSLEYHGYELKMNSTNSLENGFPITPQLKDGTFE